MTLFHLFDNQTINLAPDQSLAADFNSAVFDVQVWQEGSLQMVWTGADATDGVLMPQASVDGINWCDLLSAVQAKTVDAAAGCQLYVFTSFGYKFFRLQFTANSNTAGTINLLFYVQRGRIQQ